MTNSANQVVEYILYLICAGVIGVVVGVLLAESPEPVHPDPVVTVDTVPAPITSQAFDMECHFIPHD